MAGHVGGVWLVFHADIFAHAVFEESDVAYYFMANFAKEQDEWMRLVNMAG